MIYTSYFAVLRKLPETIVPIAICAKSPEWYDGYTYTKLAPSYSIFKEYKDCGNKDLYTTRFKDEILSNLDPLRVVSELYLLSNGNDVTLLCYEKPTDFCHRHLVANWLRDNSYQCQEFQW